MPRDVQCLPVTRLLLNDELLDAQLVRAVGAAAYGGADLGECLAAAGRVDERDLGSWYEEWTETATAVARLAEREVAAGIASRLGWRSSERARITARRE